MRRIINCILLLFYYSCSTLPPIDTRDKKQTDETIGKVLLKEYGDLKRCYNDEMYLRSSEYNAVLKFNS